MRCVGIASTVAALSLVATGCTGEFPPVAVASLDGEVFAAWKFCEADLGVRELVVSRVTEADPEDWPVVWSAELEQGATAVDRVALVDQLRGYTITTGEGWPLRPDVGYALTEATDAAGFNVLAYILEFRVSDLGSGDVVAEGTGRIS